MNYRKSLSAFHMALVKDEELMRMLYYAPKHPQDNPLSNDKKDIKGSKVHQFVISDCIIPSFKNVDLSIHDPKTRVCLFLGNSDSTTREIIFEIYSHIEVFDSIDARTLMICDRLQEVLAQKISDDISEIEFVKSTYILNAPRGYFGHRMTFTYQA